MPHRTSSGAGAAALGLGLGSCMLATRTFVPSARAPFTGEPVGQPALRGTTSVSTRESELVGTSSACNLALVGFAGAVAVATISRRGFPSRTTRLAEPVAAAAAAAVAAKAATAAKAASAAKGAAKTIGAVAGSAGAGTLAKSAEENKDDEFLAGKSLDPKNRGTPEYEAIKSAKIKRNEKEWEVKTARNPDGVFGAAAAAFKGKADLYDPLDSLSSRWLNEAGSGFNPAYQIGATEPLGFFDPLGFTKQGDEQGFRNLRTAEIKHGRVAMMASLGAVVQHFVKLPGFQDVPSGLRAVNTPPGSFGFIALFAVAGFLELGPWSEQPDKAPGNFGDPLGLSQYDEDMRNRELNNGRAAMFAAIGIIAAELLTGKDAIEQLGF